MNNKDIFNNLDNQLIISQELLKLMQLLIINEPETLKKLILKSLKNGLENNLNKTDYLDDSYTVLEAQESIIGFMGLLEALLFESLNEQSINKVLLKNKMPAIDQIDSSICDDAIIKFSVEKTASKIEQENPQELFFKEILKHWKPSKKKTIN